MPYNKYQRYRSEDLIIPYEKFPSYQQIEKIQSVKKVDPYTAFQGLDNKRRALNRAKQQRQTQTFLANYNDPTELNSFIDALTNREAVSKKFGDTWGTISTLSGTVSLIAAAATVLFPVIAPVTTPIAIATAIPTVPAAVDVMVEKGIKPIVKGKPKEALLNTMMNIGETADVFANPIKGFIHEGPKGFAKATGLTKSGRVNYDYDTGSTLTDMLLEAISDPLNWLDFGTSTAIKTTAKTTAESVTKKVVSNTVETVNKTLAKSFGEITTEGAERISKQVTKTTAQVSREWAEATADNFTKRANKLTTKTGNIFEFMSKEAKDNLRKAAQQKLLNDGRGQIQRSLVRAIQKELPDSTPSQIEIILRKASKQTATKQLNNIFVDQISDITFDTLSTDIIKSLANIQHYSDTFQRFMTKGAMLSSGYGLGVEAAKNGWKGLNAWANNFTLNKLKRATVFDNMNGLDIKQYVKAKNIWEASYKYTSDLTGEISQRDMNAFYSFMQQQLNRDKQLISNVMQDSNKPLMKAAQLDSQIKAMYNCDFKEYIAYLKEINDSENGIYSKYIQYLESVNNTLNTQALSKAMGATITTGTALFSPKELESQNIIKNLQDAIKTSKNKVELTNKLYTIKMNNAYVNAQLINDPQITEVLSIINSDENIGALLNKINEDLNALAPEVAAQIPIATRTIKEAGASFMNTRNFYNEVAGLSLEKVKGISDADLKRYIIDQVFNTDKSVSELLAEFDSITMPSLKNGLETMLQTEGFKFSDYPSFEDQIAGAYRRFLEAQEAAGIENISATIIEDFTKSLDDLVVYLPQYADELLPLTHANNQIKKILSDVKVKNLDLLESVFTDKDTIFKVADTRKLSDVGLALKTVAVKQNLDMFDLAEDVSGNIVSAANNLGKAINHTKNSLEQYYIFFDETKAKDIKNAYEEFRYKFIDNPDFTEAGAFRYLKYTDDTIEQFTQLIEFNKLAKDKVTTKDFKYMLEKHLSSQDYLNVLNPSGLMVTDFAWDAMAQSAWIAEKQLNENIINSITAFRNLSLSSKKITNDFQMVKDILSTNKLDRPKMLQQERYIKAASKINDMLEFLEQHYNSRFNKTLATEELNFVRNILNNSPELSNKYSELVDKLEAYWNGELTFKQSNKSPDTANAALMYKIINDNQRIIKDAQNNMAYSDLQPLVQQRITKAQTAIAKAQSRLEQLKAAGFDDEFTPFWWQIKEMNKDLAVEQRKNISQAVVQHYLGDEAFKEYGEEFLNFLIDPEYVSINDTLDYERYTKFLQNYFTENGLTTQTTEKNVIPYNLIPASFRQIELKYYYDVLGIHDPNLVYTLMYNGVLGWHTRGTNKINAVLTTSLNLPDRFKSFKVIKDTLNHESGHYILHNVLDAQEYNVFMQSFKQRFIDNFGENAYKDVFSAMYYNYAQQYHLTEYTDLKDVRNHIDVLINQNPRIAEEIFTFTLGRTLQDAVIPYTYEGVPTVLSTLDQKAIDAFSDEMLEELAPIAQSKPELFPYKSFEQYTRDNSVLFKETQIKSVTPWDPVKEQQELNKLISKATDANAKGAFYNLFNLTPEEFTNELAYRKRFITFNEDDINDSQLKAMFNKFNKNLPEGTTLIHDKQNHRYWYVLDKSQKVNMSGRQVYLNDNPIMRLQKKKQFNEFELVDKYINDPNNPGVTKTLNELDDALETLTGSRLGDSQGEYLSQATLEQIYQQMPQEVKDLLPNLEEWTDKQFFDAYIFNESILGSAKSKATLGMYSSNMIVNTRNAITQAQAYLKPKNEYVNSVFDSQLSISSPNSIWNSFSDNDILEALQANPEYKLVTLVDDKKYGMKTREILPTSVKAIKKAKELGGWIIPMQTYKDMYNVVNHRLGSTGFAKLWSRIMYAYKFGYLARPGAWIRNFIDTNLKSTLEMGTEYKTYSEQAHKILGDVDAMKAHIKGIEDTRLKQAWEDYGDLAQQLFNDKDRIEKFIQRRSKDGYIREEAIKEWFANNNNAKVLTYDAYKELNINFLSQGISGNIMADLYKTEGGDLWNTFTALTGNIIESGNKTENYNRLAMYLYELDHGADYTTALSKLAKTHFDYSFKSKAEQLADLVFPFTTFSMRNYSYWIEMIEKHPWIMRNYAHLMKPHWDFKDYTPEELARDQRVQTQILYGQLKLKEFNNKVLTFKANPSIQDAIQMFSDPINNVYEKLAAPLAYPINTARGEYTNPTNVIPIAGPALQATKQMQKTKTPMPSMIGVQPVSKRTGTKTANGKWSNPNLSGIDQYTDNTYRTPKYHKNIVYDSYATKGIKRYRLNLYPIVDIAHDIKMRYSVNVYNRIKNRVQTDVYNGIRYRIRLDVNRFR